MTANKRLNQIVWQRYKWFVALIVLLIVGFSLFSTVSSINAVKEAEKTTTYQHFVSDAKSYAKENKVKPDLSQAEYRDYQKGLGYNDSFTLAAGNGTFTVFIFLVVGVGLFTSLYDLQTKFNEFIFSSGFSRQRYFLKKMGLLLGVTFVSLLISMLADVLIAKMLISSHFFYISSLFIAWDIIVDLVIILAVYAVGTIVGVLVNGVLAAVLTALGFLGTCVLFTNNFLRNGPENFLDYSAASSASHRFLNVQLPLVILVISAGLMMWAAAYFFEKLSLEQEGPYLQFNYLKKPLLIFVTIYIGLIYGAQGRGYETMGEMIRTGLISGVITLIIGYLVIYRPQNIWQNVRTIFSKRR
ncbi:hypothetical protein ACVQ8P_02070 [Dellaglioa sp. BT-FLS60]